MATRNKYLFIWASFICLFCTAQDTTGIQNPDTSYLNARNLAFNGEYNAARDTLNLILLAYPDYTDVSSLLAKTYSWEGDYNTARRILNEITSEERTNKEAWQAAISNEIYAENTSIAIGLTNKALLYIKDDEELMAVRRNLLQQNTPPTKTIKETPIQQDTIEVTPKNSIGISTAIDIFDVVYDPMPYGSIEYSRETSAGKLIPRVNYSRRFGIQGIQYEFDFYPKFSKKLYGYLNYGISKSSIYPEHRVGAELFASLPKNREASLGVRYLEFAEGTATVLTASYGLYKGNYYFVARPYITPRNNAPTTFAGSIMARKYFKDAINYFGANFIYGIAPELNQLRIDGTVVAVTQLYVASQQLLFEYQFTGKQTTNVYKTNLGVTRQEFIFNSGSYFWAFSAGVKYQVKF